MVGISRIIRVMTLRFPSLAFVLVLAACDSGGAPPSSGQNPVAETSNAVSADQVQEGPAPSEAPPPAPAAVATLGDCFADSLGGIAMLRMPAEPGMPFARAYLQRVPSGRAININLWDASTDNLEGQLTQYPVIGQEGTRRASARSERVGGSFHGHPSEAMWEDLSTGGYRDTLAVRVSDTRLVSLSVQPDATRGVAAELFETLDLECLVRAPR